MNDVSVIIPSYNRENSLKLALSSVQKQSRNAEQVIVVDDGSSDNTASMIENEFADIDYIYQSNAGVSAARNRAIKQSNSEWLAFLDSDDEWLPEKLALQMQLLQANPELKICHSEEIWVRNGKRVNAMKKHAKKGGWIFQHCLPLCAMSPSSIVIHRSVFENVGLFDESLPACEDYDLWLRITARYPVLFIEQPLIVKYGGHEDQLSRQFWGMDRFRITALQKIIASSVLCDADQLAAINMLISKCAIYIAGAQKRAKTEEISRYQLIMQAHQKLLS